MGSLLFYYYLFFHHVPICVPNDVLTCSQCVPSSSSTSILSHIVLFGHQFFRPHPYRGTKMKGALIFSIKNFYLGGSLHSFNFSFLVMGLGFRRHHHLINRINTKIRS
jgi:hypothetical protein